MRKGKVNNKFLHSLPADDKGMVDVPNIVHVTWDNGEAYISASDNLYKAVCHAQKNPDADFIEDLTKTFRKLCKAQKAEEIFFGSMPGMQLQRFEFDDLNSPEAIEAINNPKALTAFDKSVNQVDKMFAAPNFKLAAMIDPTGDMVVPKNK